VVVPRDLTARLSLASAPIVLLHCEGGSATRAARREGGSDRQAEEMVADRDVRGP
jgi:hypothetical protein